MSDLPIYHALDGCPACGALANDVSITFDFDKECIQETCGTCGYHWDVAPRYAAHDNGFIFRRHDTDVDCVACGWMRLNVTYVRSETIIEAELRNYPRRFLERVTGQSLVARLPFLVRRCQRCGFRWPETPLNHPDVDSVVPLHPKARQ